jgi:Glycosyltransferase family 87/WD40-like Beta Propeller Repeat
MDHVAVVMNSVEKLETSESSPVPKLDPPNRRWHQIAEWVLLVGMLATFAAHSLLPAWESLNSEFPNYYLAASLYRERIPLDRIYEWTWFQRQNDHLGVRDGLVSFAPNPPTLILSLVPFTTLKPLTAKRVWLVLNLIFLVTSLWMLHLVTSLTWRRIGLIALLCVLPLHIDFLFGRHYVLILTLICVAYYASSLNRQRTSGVLLGTAAAMKLFPALFVILFIWKRNWGAVIGMVLSATAITSLSLLMFGVEVHRVFLNEVLSQASRGDWLGPYALSQNSFITLWSHLFLIEPELNPHPWINSSVLYAVVQAATVIFLVFSFLLSFRGTERAHSASLQWAGLVPLLLLLSTTSATDYSCLLIFAAIVGFDALSATGDKARGLIFLLLYVVACAPVSGRIAHWFPLSRLLATTGLYLLLMYVPRAGGKVVFGLRWLAAGLIAVAFLTLYNLHTVRNRAEDFGRRLPSTSTGYRSANPVPTADGVVFTKMESRKYEAVLLKDATFRDIAMPGDALSVAGAGNISVLYSELSGHQSFITRQPIEPVGSPNETLNETLTEGQEPALSANGGWLAFIREEHGQGSAWLLATDSQNASLMVLPGTYHVLEVSVTSEGDVIAAAGRTSDPHLFLVRHRTGEVVALTEFPHPARYPSVSPDGERLAFSRREHGSWHLVVREFASGREQQLTHASCNAISPSWENAETLLYATDCGRGVGLSAIARAVLSR